MKRLLNDKVMQNPIALYIFAGALSFAIELTVLHGALLTTNSRPAAVTIGFIAGLTASFLLQKLLVFKDNQKNRSKTSKQVVAYLSLVALNYTFTLLFVEIVSDFISITIARTIALIITTGWNFIIYKLFIFKK